MGKFILEGVDKCADMGDDLGVDEVNDIDWSVEMRLIMVVCCYLWLYVDKPEECASISHPKIRTCEFSVVMCIN